MTGFFERRVVSMHEKPVGLPDFIFDCITFKCNYVNNKQSSKKWEFHPFLLTKHYATRIPVMRHEPGRGTTTTTKNAPPCEGALV